MKLRSKMHMEPYLLNKYYGSSQSQIKSGVHLPGTAGNYISTPDSVLNSITGDIDIRVYAKLDDWTPAAQQDFISKYNSTGSQRSWKLGISSIGRIVYVYSSDGVTPNTWDTGYVPGYADGSAHWIRLTHDVDNGAGSNRIAAFTSDDGVVWTQVATITGLIAGVVNLFDSTATLDLGGFGAGANNPFAGTVYYAEVRNGIDGPIAARFDSSQVQVSGSQLPASINGWTWNGSALYKRDDYVRLPGTSGNYLSYPDTVANSVTGDIDIRAHVSLDDWTPATTMYVIAKEQVGLRSYCLGINGTSTGKIDIRYSVDGINAVEVISSTGVPFADGSTGWIRATRTAATDLCNFYTSPDGVTWTLLGSANVAGSAAGNISDNASVIELGSRAGGGSNNWAGNVYYSEVRNGIGGPVVASFNGADNQVQTPWTINGSAWNWEGSSFTGKPGIALSLPGSGQNNASTPDTAGNSITGDLDIRVKASLNWPAPSARMDLVAKYLAAGNQRAYRFVVNISGLELGISPDGTSTALISPGTVSFPPFTANQVGWVRAVWDSVGKVAKFYYGTDGVTWTQLEGNKAANIVSIADTTAVLEVGSNGANEPVLGNIFYAEVRNGIDGPVVAKFDPTNMAKTGTRTPASTVQPGGTPNLLTPNDASFETSVAGWTAAANTTIAQSGAQFLDGIKSLSMTATAIGASGASQLPASEPVIGGKLYTVRASLRAATVGRTTSVSVLWYDAAAVFISTSTASAGTDVTTGWTETSISVLAPPTARFAQVAVGITDVTQLAAEVHYVDRVSLVEAAEVWTLNGSAWDLVAV